MGNRKGNELTAATVNSLSKPGLYGDGLGLWLQVSRVGERITKSWIFRFMLDGKARYMGLGPVHTFSLKEARERARLARQQAKDGIDPIDARREKRKQQKLEAAKRVTFKEACERYTTAHKTGWKNAKHAAQWETTLASAYPAIGSLPVNEIDTGLVLKVLEPIWHSTPETATRLRGRIESVLSWATTSGYRSGDNPARWRGHLDQLLPKRSKVRAVKHHPALPFEELPAFMAELRQREGISPRALEFTILSATRTGETIGAKWPEIDFDKKTWAVPAERMKMGKEHRVPLSDRALAILEALPREDGNAFVFIGGKKGAPLSNMAMLELMKGMRPGYVPHGFRSTFRDWAAETTNYPNHVVEMALAHVVGDKVEAAYRRGVLFEKRRKLMTDWCRFCSSPPAIKDASGKVVLFNKAAVS
ncbi:Integrase [Rhizobiales bacterium GAS113]|nr:Integrase [Rhizobiales bacterium GAS113]